LTTACHSLKTDERRLEVNVRKKESKKDKKLKVEREKDK
jgi:hypothetical protein